MSSGILRTWVEERMLAGDGGRRGATGRGWAAEPGESSGLAAQRLRFASRVGASAAGWSGTSCASATRRIDAKGRSSTAHRMGLMVLGALVAGLSVAAGAAQPVSIQASLVGPTAEEGEETLELKVRRIGPTDGVASVKYATCPNETVAQCKDLAWTAVAGVDYKAAAGVVEFGDGDDEPKTVRITLIDDTADEPDETFRIVLYDPVNAEVPDPVQVCTIEDDDDAPTLSAGAASASESAEALVFPLTLDPPSGRMVAVPWSTADGTATAGADYVAGSGTVTFAPGATAGEAAVALLDDDRREGDETVTLAFGAADHVQLAADEVSGKIVDDETGLIRLDVGDASGYEEASITFELSLSGRSTERVSARYETRDATAKANGEGRAENDYAPVSDGIVHIEPGDVSASVRIEILGDKYYEGDEGETFTLALTDVVGAAQGKNGVGKIIDEQGHPQVGLPRSHDVDEDAGTIDAHFSLSSLSVFETVVIVCPGEGNCNPGTSSAVAAAAATATRGEDYEAESRRVTVPPGESRVAVPMRIIDDNLDEGNETATVWARAEGWPSRVASTVLIRDNDRAVLSVKDANASEGDEIRFRVSFGGVRLERAVTLFWRTVDGTASALDGDYQAVPRTEVAIEPGTTGVDLVVATTADEIYERSESFEVHLSDVSGVDVGDAVAVGTITDDDEDGAPRVSVRSAPTYESEPHLAFEVTLDRESGRNARVAYRTVDDTATAGDDYEAVRGTLVIDAGQTRGEIRVPLIDDGLVEDSEHLSLEMTEFDGFAVETVSPLTVRGEILDDDDAELPALTIAGAEAGEGDGVLNFLVSLDEAAADGASVRYATSSGTAVEGEDFETANGTLTFAAEETEKMIAVALIDDAIAEDTATFTVTLSDVENARYATRKATGSILDDDPLPVASVADATGREGSGAEMAFEVSLSGLSESRVSVGYRLAPGTAEKGKDYLDRLGTLDFAPLATEPQNVVVRLVDDGLHELDETFTLELHSPDELSLAGDGAAAVGTIVDDEAKPTFTDRSRQDFTIREGGLHALRLELAGPRSQYPVVYNLSLEGEGTHAATPREDLTMRATQLTIPPRKAASEAVFLEALVDRKDEEQRECFAVTYRRVSGGGPESWQQKGCVEDTDRPPSLAISARAAGREGEAVDFDVRLNVPSGKTVTVSYTVEPGSATRDDLGTEGGEIVFAPGEDRATLSVPLVADGVNESGEERFTVTITAVNAELSTPRNRPAWADGYTWDGVATGIVRDTDAEPVIAVEDLAATEGESTEFVVEMDIPNHGPVVLDYAIRAISATQGEDYTATVYGGQLTFAVAETRKAVAVSVVDDDVAEPDERFEFELMWPRHLVISERPEVVLQKPLAVATIIDNDELQVAVSDAEGDEGGTLTFEVRLSAEPWETVTVAYATADGDATAPADYAAVAGTLTFPAGTSTAAVTVELPDDALDEPDETFELILSSPANAEIDPSAGQATGTIRDNDEPPSLSVADAGEAEEGGTLTFDVALTPASGRSVTVAVRTVEGTALGGVDYVPRSSRLTFGPGETLHQVEISLLTDDAYEDTEAFSLRLGAPEHATIARPEAVGRILNVGDQPALTIADAEGPEGGTADFVVELAPASTLEVTVTVATVDGTAMAGTDYEATSAELSFAAGETSKTVSVPLLKDDADEPDEAFAVTLADATGATLDVATAAGTVLDVNEPPLLDVDDAEATEGGELAFAVRLTGTSARELRLAYATRDATATAGEDYEAASGVLVIAPGETGGSIAVAGVDDDAFEGPEHLLLTLEPPEHARLVAIAPTGTILDDEQPPTLAIADAGAAAEGGTLAFDVELSVSAGLDVTVDYRTEDGTATAGLDYAGNRGVLTFPRGTKRQRIDVSLFADDVDEPAETLSVVLGDASHATVAVDRANGEIIDVDDPPVLSVAGGSAVEGGQIVCVVSARGLSSAPVRVAYATADGTAAAGSDYTAAEGELELLPGQTTASVAVALLRDSEEEPDETFSLTLRDPEGATLGTATAHGRIVNVDAERVVLDVTGASAVEGGDDAVFTVSLSIASDDTVAVDYATADLTAEAGSDYHAGSGRLSFAPGMVSQTVVVAAIDDDIDEPDEAFRLELSSPSNAVLGTSAAEATIHDDDDAPKLSVAGEGGAEGEYAEFAVTLSRPSGRTVTVRYSTADETARAGVDYRYVDGVMAIPPGSETGEVIAVALLDDALYEDEEVFRLELLSSSGAELAVASADAHIEDDDAPPRVSVDDTRVAEGGTAGFVVTLSGARSVPASVLYETVDGTAVAGRDYAATSGRLTFGPDTDRLTVDVTVHDDALDEPEERFFLALSAPEGATLDDADGTATVVDDDAAPVLTIEGGRGTEGGTVVFTVTLSGETEEAVAVEYASADGTALAGHDYAAVEGLLRFAPGVREQTIVVDLVVDDVVEAEETFVVTLSDATGAVVGRAAATGVVVDHDTVTLSVADAEVEEGGTLAFVVARNGASGSVVAARYETRDGTAVAGEDYAQATGRFEIAADEDRTTIEVASWGDDVDEPHETLALLLLAPEGAGLDRDRATGTILDDDDAPTLTIADASVAEHAGPLRFAVRLSAPSGREVAVDYATADVTARASEDYRAAAGTLHFAPGATEAWIDVAVLDDELGEADEETLEVALSGARNATLADPTAIGTVRDDDTAPPALSARLPEVLMCVGDAPYGVDLADYFGGDELRFSAVSSTPEVATASLAGSWLTVAPVAEGESSVVVTATNDAGSAESSVSVRVVTDPAEIAAVESALASIARAVLTSVTGSVRERFAEPGAPGEQGASTRTRPNPVGLVPDAVAGRQWPVPPMGGNRSGGWDGRGLFESRDRGGDGLEATNRTYRRGMAPFSFSLDSAQSGSTGPGWAVWGRGDVQRFESGIDGSSHDGTLAAIHLGADARVGDWLAGLSLTRSTAEADYRFERSVDACGIGDGMVEAELTSIHPYIGRQIGRGQVWAALGAGGGDVALERCENGQRRETDLSMRLAALGGRHPFAGGERMAVSVVEEIAVLDLTTGDASGPIGDRSVSVEQVRVGLEASGVAPAGCKCSLTTFMRAFARGDWGDGATGTGLELVAGVRYRNHSHRLGIDAGVRALALHSVEDAREQSANVTLSVLPKPDGTGWQASLAWRRGLSDARLDTLSGMAPWTVPTGNLLGVKSNWIAESRLGYGIALPRGSATPFVELHAGHSQGSRARFGVRQEYGDRVRGLRFEWGIEQSSLAGRNVLLEAVGRF